MSQGTFNPFLAAQTQFDRIAEVMGLDAPARQLLRRPMHEHRFAIPARMDDRRVRVFDGFRIVHNDARGPAWGGFRFHPQETPDGLRALAMWMTWKTAVVDIPLGGSMGGVVCNPHDLSRWEQEVVCRAWIRRMARDLGPERDVVAPDVMTRGRHMMWMLDEYEAVHGGRRPGAITGKPILAGGSRGREKAAGFGVVYTLREALKEHNLAPDRAVAAVQGFGAVGRHAIELLTRIGVKVRAVACLDRTDLAAKTLVRDDGIDWHDLQDWSDAFGNIDCSAAEASGYESKEGDAWLSEPVDILIPAALENQITDDTVGRIGPSVKVVVEAANGPTSESAEQELRSRGVVVIPDLLANAGGTLCSYFEQVQASANAYWGETEVMSRIDHRQTAAFFEVSELARAKSLSLRDAALIVAVDRVAAVVADRGWV